MLSAGVQKGCQAPARSPWPAANFTFYRRFDVKTAQRGREIMFPSGWGPRMKCLEYRYDRYLRAYYYRELEERSSTLVLPETGEPALQIMDGQKMSILYCASFEAGREALRQQARDNGFGECRVVKENGQRVPHAEIAIDFVQNTGLLL